MYGWIRKTFLRGKTNASKVLGDDIMKLFFTTYAGGSASYFNKLAAILANDCECVLIEYAGHSTRSREPFYNSFDDMVEDIVRIMEGHLTPNEPFCIFGYSMGALVAYEALMKPVSRGVCKHLFVAAHYPPASLMPHVKYSELPDKTLSAEMQKYGGLDKRIIENKRFLNIYLGIIRSDYRLLEDYIFHKETTQLSCGITVFYSEEDTPYKVMRNWENYSFKETVFHRYEGSHFFLRNQEQEIADDIRNILQDNNGPVSHIEHPLK